MRSGIAHSLCRGLGAFALLALLWAPSPAAADDASEPPTFHRNIEPLLQRSCQECHRPEKIAPMSFMTYEETRPWAKSIRNQVASGAMPPFGAEGPLGRFLHDPRLTEFESNTFIRWVDTGARRGDPDDAPPARRWPDPTTWQLGEPDLIITTEPYEVQPGEDEYVLHLTDHTFEEDLWISGIEVLPSNWSVVHHCNVHLLNVVRKKNFIAPGVTHYSGFDPIETSAGLSIFGWLPGQEQRMFDPGTAKVLYKGGVLAVVMHYAPLETSAINKISIGLHFADGLIDRKYRAFMCLSGEDKPIVIPPGEPNFRLTDRRTFEYDSLVRSFGIHMHLRGKASLVNFIYPDGRTENIFHVPAYDFDWQMPYELTEPLSVPAGTVAEFIGIWDNSADNDGNPDPNVTVRGGFKTRDEMWVATLQYEVPSMKFPAFRVENGRRVAANEPAR